MDTITISYQYNSYQIRMLQAVDHSVNFFKYLGMMCLKQAKYAWHLTVIIISPRTNNRIYAPNVSPKTMK